MNFLLKIVVVAVISFFFLSCSTTQTTKYDDHSTYPAWAKDAVFYQIFPERFHNGDKSNDPTIEDHKGAWPHDEITEWSISPWTADWYKLQPWEEKNGRGFYYNAQLRRYGGDIQGVIDKLDYLKELGINAIYFNPIFESPSLHKYDATYYHHIDDNFGPDPAKDRKIITTENTADPKTWKWTTADSLFLKLLNIAHEKGIRIIIDGVFNHTGIRFWAFEDILKNMEKSPFVDWYTIKKWDNPETAENEFEYECWFGAKTLPEFKEDKDGIVEGPQDHIFSAVKRWMDPNDDGDPSDGIDGWRLDVAEKVSPEFWKKFRKHVKAINPQAYITAELFWDDWNNKKLMNPKPWLQGDQFDANMNYPWGAAVLESITNPNTEKPMTTLINELDLVMTNCPDTINYILQNLYDSHDTERLGTHIVNPEVYLDTYVNLNNNADYDPRKPNTSEIKRQKLLVLIQMTSLGAPMIYYGDEAGMWGTDDPDERKPMIWQDFKYENETHHPFGKERPNDPVNFNADLFNYYKKTISLRNEHEVLRRGSWIPVIADDAKNVLIYKRSNSTGSLIIVINNSDIEQNVTIPQENEITAVKNLLNNDEITVSEAGFNINLSPVSGTILLPLERKEPAKNK